MRTAFALVAAILLGAGHAAAEIIVRDGHTLTVDGVRYHLDGVDTPEPDQVCLDQAGDTWACGIDARDKLKAFIGDRKVECADLGPGAPAAGRMARCQAGGEDLGQWLVREGWALTLEPSAKGRYLDLQVQARAERRGIWKGCFAAPKDLRRWSKAKAELLGDCPVTMTDERRTRDLLFPDRPAMPPRCAIKGKLALRANVTGHIGIYHLKTCRTYVRAGAPQRWFCSEEDAKAAGFRKALNC